MAKTQWKWIRRGIFLSLFFLHFTLLSETFNQDRSDIHVLKIFLVPKNLAIAGIPFASSLNADGSALNSHSGVFKIISLVLQKSAYESPSFEGIGFYYNDGMSDLKKGLYPTDDGLRQSSLFIPKNKLYIFQERLLKDKVMAFEIWFKVYYPFPIEGAWYIPSSHFKPYAVFGSEEHQFRNWDPHGTNYYIDHKIEFDLTNQLLHHSEVCQKVF